LKNNSVVHIPRVYFASRRVLIMEFIEGGKVFELQLTNQVNDLSYLHSNNIDKYEVSRALSNMYAQMIFLSGWVHCDPHPGNVFVRPATPSLFRKIASRFIPGMHSGNFQIVLLDHGLYRNIPNRQRFGLSFNSRILYARLWTSVIQRNEERLLECTRELFDGRLGDQTGDGRVDYHRLLASMMTGRSWGGVLSV
jgi:aarF domain-containing kinase